MLSAKHDKLLHSKQPFFHSFYLGDIIGEGSSGTVYEIKDNNGNHYALKVILVTLEDDTNTIHLNEQDSIAKKQYLDEMTHEILAEVRVMQKLEDTSGIVPYQEYDVIEVEDLFANFILIKMDLLKPLNKLLRMKESEFSLKEVAVLGVELLTALSECRKYNIIHRDIKPSNIFVTKDNHYLLGDFGSARLLEKTMMASHKGTLCYMAPEIAAGQSFNSTIDIYSLGLMMYQLLNNRKLPFLNDTFKFSEIEEAVEKRLSGALLPYPKNADKKLGEIILKMCAYSPKERYSSPDECKKDLVHYLSNEKQQMTCKEFITPIISENKVSYTGISSGNVNSSGTISSDENWLYYSQDVSGKRGIRVSKDGNKKEVLCNHIMHYINITKDFLFFSSQYITTSPGLYRMDKAGGNLTCLDNSKIFNLVVYMDYVYYFKASKDCNLLCRIPNKGGEFETLAKFDSQTYLFYPYKNQLYIYDTKSAQLVSLSLNDKKKTVIINNALRSFCIEDDFLYFLLQNNTTEYSNEIYVYKLSSLTSSPININDSKIITFPYGIQEFNVSNKVIFASSKVTSYLDKKLGKEGIWKVNNDGTDLVKIYTGNASNLQLTNHQLYFTSNYMMYYMDLDGNNIQNQKDISLFSMMK